jgi:hypothetical protein
MDPVTLLFRLPFLPVKGLIQLGEMIQEQVEQEQYDPASVRRQLEDIEEARVSGEISDPDLIHAEAEAVGRLVQPAPAANTQNRERS